MTLQGIVEQYGYLAVFVGCFIEGETVLVLAGFAAHLGYLSLAWVMATAALAGFIGDETWFFVGRRYGDRLLARFPRLAKAQPLVRKRLDRYGGWVVFFVRFAVGLRVASPIVMGASGMHPARFTPPNAAGAVVWALTMGAAGYTFGAAFTGFLAHARRYEEIAFSVLAIVVLAVVGFWRRREHRRERIVAALPSKLRS